MKQLESITHSIPRVEIGQILRSWGIDPDFVSEVHLLAGEAQFVMWLRDGDGEVSYKNGSAVTLTVTVPIK